jgi:glycosyltransferase involved in cell wall biosynthesis
MPAARAVVFLNRFYAPDVAATGQMLADLAEHLAEDGWETTVVTGRDRYAPGDAPLPRTEVRNGVRVVRVWTTTLGRTPIVGRALGYASYMCGAFCALTRARRGTIVVAMTDPPFLLLPVLAAARLRGHRVGTWVQDVYPQLAVALGVLARDTFFSRLLHRVAGAAYRACDVVVTLGPTMSRVLVEMGAPAERVVHVPNWTDADAVHPIPPAANPFVREHGLAERFVVLYSGTAGRAHTFDAVLRAARVLRADPDVLFLFVGGGARMPALRSEVARAGLEASVRFLPYQPRETLAASLSSADVALVTESPDVVGLVLPSKAYGAMASGRPILYVGATDSEVARAVREHGCGVVVRHDDAEGVVRAIRSLRAAPAARARMGAAGRHAAETLYDRRRGTRRFGAVLTDVARAPRAAAL